MTSQAMRARRRADQAAKERQERIELALSILFLAFLLFASCIAGANDRMDDQRQLEYWAERGVTVQRW